MKMELVNDRSYLHDEVSIKIPKVLGSESFWVGKHMEVLGEWWSWRRHGSSVPLHIHPVLSFSFIWMLTCVSYHNIL